MEIEVIAEVEEYLTKRKYNASNVIKVYDKDIKVDLVKSAESFKPGLKYTAHVSKFLYFFTLSNWGTLSAYFNLLPHLVKTAVQPDCLEC